MGQEWERALQRHEENAYAHGQLHHLIGTELEALTRPIQTRFLEAEQRLSRLEKFQYTLAGVGLAVAAMLGGGLLAFVSGHLVP